MRILTVGFSDEYVKELEKELDKYFICIVDNAKDMYDATNFTDFRHYELVIIVDEGVKFSLERYVNEVKKKKSETKIIILSENRGNKRRLDPEVQSSSCSRMHNMAICHYI